MFYYKLKVRILFKGTKESIDTVCIANKSVYIFEKNEKVS